MLHQHESNSLWFQNCGWEPGYLNQYSVWLHGLDDRGSITNRQIIIPLASASRLALGSTQPPVQWVLGVLSPVVKRGRGVILTTHLHVVLRLRMSRSYTSSQPMCSMACNRITLPFTELRVGENGVLAEICASTHCNAGPYCSGVAASTS
jgi:hypothetical protein